MTKLSGAVGREYHFAVIEKMNREHTEALKQARIAGMRDIASIIDFKSVTCRDIACAIEAVQQDKDPIKAVRALNADIQAVRESVK